MMCFGTSVVNATDVASDLLEKYQDMQYSTEAGINQLDYSSEYRKLYTATLKAKDKIPSEQYDSFVAILGMYEDVKLLWQEWYPSVAGKGKSYVEKRYPYVKLSVNHDIWGDYDTKEVIGFIWSEAKNRTEELQLKIQKESK